MVIIFNVTYCFNIFITIVAELTTLKNQEFL